MKNKEIKINKNSIDRNFIIFIGKSGCGKGTQAEKLLEFMDKNGCEETQYISSGKLIRGFIDKYLAGNTNKHTGKIIHDMVTKGNRLPTSIAVWNFMNAIINDSQKGYNIILDGSPRTLMEHEVLRETIQFFNFRKPIIVYLDLPDRDAANRLLSRGRNDDKEKQILSRLEWYKKDVSPIINKAKKDEYYKFIKIDARKDIETQHKEIIKEIFNINI
ncbi:MAG: nucleoside monophosphate kinase [Candidatus Nomurabacteria bacterium]